MRTILTLAALLLLAGVGVALALGWSDGGVAVPADVEPEPTPAPVVLETPTPLEDLEAPAIAYSDDAIVVPAGTAIDPSMLSYDKPIVVENPDGTVTIHKLAKFGYADGRVVMKPVTIEAELETVPATIVRRPTPGSDDR